MGITLALSPVQREDLFSKHAITNASFRARRLPGQWPHNFPLSLFMLTVKLFLYMYEVFINYIMVCLVL